MAGPHEKLAQPLLPRISMIWFFIAVVIVAIALYVIRAADQGQALATAMVFSVVFVGACALFSAGSFLVAYCFGAMEVAVRGEGEQPSSPFIDGSYPEQVIPPKPSEDA